LSFQLEELIAPEQIIHTQAHHTPLYTTESFQYRDEVVATNGENHTYHAGAYLGDGLHGGAITSAVRVAELIGMSQESISSVESKRERISFTAALFDDIAELMNISDPDPFAEFERLSASAEIVIRDASQFGVLSYIETGYFGGCGTQSAIAWSRGKILLGALKSETTWNGESYEETPIGKSAINKILSVLGVWTDRKKDEFDMLGLGNFRDTESAVSSAS